MARYQNGWIKIHRGVSESDLAQNPYLYALWTLLLTWATYKETKIIWKGTQRTLPPGSALFGAKEIADRWQCSKTTITRWLKYLNETGRILLETSHSGCLVVIANWSHYQDKEDIEMESEFQDVNAESTSTEREVALNEEYKNKENTYAQKKSKSSRRRKKIEYPPEFEEIYQTYPRSEGKSEGFKIYQRDILTSEDRKELLAAIAHYKKRKAKLDPDYLMHFKTFMNQWRDWLDPKTGSVTANGPPVKPLTPGEIFGGNS